MVAKSTNESEAARSQLAQTAYARLADDWSALPWGGSVVHHVRALSVNEADKSAILAGNARRIFKIDVSPVVSG